MNHLRYKTLLNLSHASEDRGDVVLPHSLDEKDDPVRLIVADAANGMRASHAWARLLALSFTTNGFDLARVRSEWKLSRPGINTFASFIGLELSQREFAWRATRAGDCCLIHLRKGLLVTSLPNNIAGLSASASLLASLWTVNDHLVEQRQGSFSAGDCFVLTSDGMANHLFHLICERKPLNAQQIQALHTELTEQWQEVHGSDWFLRNAPDLGVSVLEILTSSAPATVV